MNWDCMFDHLFTLDGTGTGEIAERRGEDAGRPLSKHATSGTSVGGWERLKRDGCGLKLGVGEMFEVCRYKLRL